MIIIIPIGIETPDGTEPQAVLDTVREILTEELREDDWKLTSDVEPPGFQHVADHLSELTQRKFSRQGIHQLWKRRDFNGFPDRKTWVVNGKEKEGFDLQEITEWWYHRNA